jgi:hypothetical protein
MKLLTTLLLLVSLAASVVDVPRIRGYIARRTGKTSAEMGLSGRNDRYSRAKITEGSLIMKTVIAVRGGVLETVYSDNPALEVVVL